MIHINILHMNMLYHICNNIYINMDIFICNIYNTYVVIYCKLIIPVYMENLIINIIPMTKEKTY